MDDERERKGIKVDLTAIEDDDYLRSRFKKLSSSGHNLTPMSGIEIKNYNMSLQSVHEDLLGNDRKGIYVCLIGGLPLFSSGFRVDSKCNIEDQTLTFSEPCDPEHIQISEKNEVLCARSNMVVGYIEQNNTSTEVLYKVYAERVRFYDVHEPWPVDSQPENYWGSEGQYRAWNGHELSSHPLSY